MKSVAPRTGRRWRIPRGIWFSFAVFSLAEAILHHWLAFSVSPAYASAAAGTAASEGARPAAARRNLRPMYPYSVIPGGAYTVEESRASLINNPVPASSIPRRGPPIVPGAAVVLEAWPGTRVPEEFAPSIQPSPPATPVETGDPAVSRPEQTTPVAEPFAGALLCAGLGGIYWMMRYRRVRI
jgi:hypothetical protein